MACLKNNGHLSDEFMIQRGVRQGCPVSSLIFILCVEILAAKINNNNEIKGIQLKTGKSIDHVKITQYADDGTLFLNNIAEMTEAINVIKVFSKLAGTELNLDKCEGLWIGKSKANQNNCNNLGMKWPLDPIRYLGIYIGHNKTECTYKNWHKKVELLKETIKNWKFINFTLFGKVNFLKSMAISKLIYSATCLPVPEGIEKGINNIIYEFIWGKVDKISRKSALCKIEDGGIGMIDIKSHFEAIKASWVSRILNSNIKSSWSIIPKYTISKYGPENIIIKLTFQNEKQFPYLKQCSKFYKEIIHAYNKSKSINENTFCETIKDQVIWGNRYLTHKKQTLYFKNWISDGIINIKNLRFINGKLDETFIHQKIRNKCNIFHQVALLKKTLLPYKHLLEENIPEAESTLSFYLHEGKSLDNIPSCKSKFYYENIISKVCNSQHKCMMKWNDKFGIDFDDFNVIWKSKVKYVRDKKIAETNFKTLHCILPCGKNLYKWKKKDSNMCLLCNDIEDIEHLLFHCKYARQIWCDVEKALNVNIDITDILFGKDTETTYNFIISLICHLIYREWLEYSLEDLNRTYFIGLKTFKFELLFHRDVHQSMGEKSLDVVVMLNQICEYIENH